MGQRAASLVGSREHGARSSTYQRNRDRDRFPFRSCQLQQSSHFAQLHLLLKAQLDHLVFRVWCGRRCRWSPRHLLPFRTGSFGGGCLGSFPSRCLSYPGCQVRERRSRCCGSSDASRCGPNRELLPRQHWHLRGRSVGVCACECPDLSLEILPRQPVRDDGRSPSCCQEESMR